MQIIRFNSSFVNALTHRRHEENAQEKMLAQEALEDFQNMFDWYSDWHKDVYGYRPHGDAELNAKFSELKNRAVA